MNTNNKKFINLFFVLINVMFLGGLCLIIAYWILADKSVSSQRIQTLSSLTSIGGSFIIVGSSFGLLASFYHFGLAYLVFEKRKLDSNYFRPFVFNLFCFVLWFATSVIGLFAITNGNFPAQIINSTLVTNWNVFGGLKLNPEINESNWTGYFGSDIALLLISFGFCFIARKEYFNHNKIISLQVSNQKTANQNLTKEF
ncbi:hypothetical protein [Mycoplasmoides pirum]|uniref:hypothetical protein n=1 Tax=Mycoplasmoides pirum TaxID=2122 RepID=UPI0004846572|nr:hypothetical protein [Mycoplasmoides pirum]